MICQHCRATIEDKDKFCPKCGRSVTISSNDPASLGIPGTPSVVETQSVDGPRVHSNRTPLPEGGTKYRGLKTAADMLIKSAAIIKIICYVLAALGALSTMIWMRDKGAVALLLGVAVGIVIATFGWLIWLMSTIHGELMYVTIDIEEDLRRRT